MKRLIQATAELLEARAELLREQAASIQLGVYARAYKDGQNDLMGCDCGCEEQADESPDCG